MGIARYDAVADFYESGWADSVDDPPAAALLELVGPVDGLRVLDVACGHGRVTRELARRGAHVVGVDVSGALIAKAEAAERTQPLGIQYVHSDIASQAWQDGLFDVVVCSFGLSDIDDLAGALANIGQVLRPGGIFVFSVLHPCFAGGQNVSGSWPTAGTYRDEGWWTADGALSSLRREVGAHHRTLATYLNALRRHDLWVDEVVEPPPTPDWAEQREDAARFPEFLVARCVSTL